MKRGTLLRTFISAAALAATSSASAQARGPGPFAGSFAVASNTTVSVTSPMAITEERTTRERLVISRGARTDLSVQVTNDLGEHCTLTANRSGATSISFASGQRCTFTDSVRSLRMNFTLRSGSGSISGERISLTFSWGVASNGGFLSVSGSASQHSAGNRTGGRAEADADAPAAAPVAVAVAPVAVPAAPAVEIAPSPTPAIAVEPVAPMMPMSGTPSRTSSHHTTTARPRAAATPTVEVAPTPPVAVSAPTPAWGSAPAAAADSAPASAWGSAPTPAATNVAPASAWGSTPAAQSPQVGSAWTSPTTSAPAWGAPSTTPLPIDANTPGAVVLPSGWIIGPLIGQLASAIAPTPEAANAWASPQPSAPAMGTGSWGTYNAPAAWSPSPGGPGVVLGAPGATGTPSYGSPMAPASPRPVAPQTLPTNGGGPGIVFGTSP